MKMRYLLKKRGPKGGTHPVYLALYSGDATELIFTGNRIQLKDWSVNDRAPKDHAGDIFKSIEKVKSEVQQSIRRLEADEKPVTPFTVKQQFATAHKDKQAGQREKDRKAKGDLINVSKLANNWIDNEIFRFRASTQKAVKESIKAFTDYLRLSGLASLERKDLTQDVISGYEKYLLVKRKLSDNTHGKRMKHLRWFLKSLNFEIKNIKLRSAKKTIISLTLNELESLEAVDVSFSNEFQKAKDLFLLGCYTGLRVSDLKRLNHTNTQNGLISLKLLKNNREVKIPIVSAADKILSRYGYKAPKLSEQGLNENIKQVCEKAGLTAAVAIDTTRGGQRISKSMPKYELITSHIAGKTFITLAPEKWKLTPPEIAAIVGKDLKTLLNSYFNLPADEARRKMIQSDNTLRMKVV